MLQFHLSAALAKDLKSQTIDNIEMDQQALQWYAHVVSIARRKCVVAMELQSRYAMVFCGMTKASFESFPQIFVERLIREVFFLAELDDSLSEDDLKLLAELIFEVTSEVNFGIGTDRSVLSHIRQVKEHLDILVYEDGYPLPTDDRSAVIFGLQTNETLRKRKIDRDYFRPIDVFRDFWLGFLDHVKSRKKIKSNIVNVDFVGKQIKK